MALRNYRLSFAKNIVWLFVIFYGFTIVIEDKAMDASRIIDKFEAAAKTQITTRNFISLLYDKDSQTLDIIEPVLVFLVSRVTTNWHFLFAVFGLIFGFFYSRNIWYLIDRAGGQIKKINLINILVFSVLVGFWQINGFRFWTATHMFFFGAMPFLLERKKKYLWVAVLAIFMHFTYLIPLGILFVYTVAGNKLNLFFYFFIATLFLSSLNLNSLNEVIKNHVPDIFHSRVDSYVNDNADEGLKDAAANLNWYAYIYANLLKWVASIFLIVLYLKTRVYIQSNKPLLNLFSFSLFFFGFANVFSLIPSGSRFITLAEMFSLALAFWYLQNMPENKTLIKTVQLSIPALLLFSIVTIRTAFDTIGVATVIGNPISASFFVNDKALIKFIKN